MKKVICFEGIRNDWYFNFDRHTFINANEAYCHEIDSYAIDFNEIPFYVSKTALKEFGCSLEFIVKFLKIQEIEAL